MTRRDFADKVVVITGAAGGLGRALARSFADAGARVAALDRDAAGSEALAAELRSEGRQARHAQQVVGARAQAEDIAAAIVLAARKGTHLLLPRAHRENRLVGEPARARLLCARQARTWRQASSTS